MAPSHEKKKTLKTKKCYESRLILPHLKVQKKRNAKEAIKPVPELEFQ